MPVTDLKWTEAVQGKEYASILGLVESRPIVAWFDRKHKRGVRLLVRLNNTFYESEKAKDEWGILSDDGRLCTAENRTLQDALRVLTLSGENWKMCEFKTSAEYHQAVLDYIQ